MEEQNLSKSLGPWLPNCRKSLSPVITWATCPSDSSKFHPKTPSPPVQMPRCMVCLTDKLLSIRQCVPSQPRAIPFLLCQALGPEDLLILEDPANGGSRHLSRKPVVMIIIMIIITATYREYPRDSESIQVLTLTSPWSLFPCSLFPRALA